MPVYDYTCKSGHTIEQRQGIEVDSVPCPVCSTPASRVQVYTSQYMQAETGPVGGKKNPVPPSDTYYGKDVSEFVEASEEIADGYAKQEAQTGVAPNKPNLFRRGVQAAKKKNPKVRA